MALLLALGVVAWEHVIHAYVLSHGGSLVEHVTHVLRDGMLAVPVAVLAVLAAFRLAGRMRAAASLPLMAGLVSIGYSLLMVPSGIVHHLIENRSVGMVAPHAGGGLEGSHAFGGMLLHALRDAGIGQVAALPIALAALAWLARPRTERSRSSLRVRLAVGSALVVVLAPIGTASAETSSTASGGCDSSTHRFFNVSAINVRITVNKFKDNDPFGFMYVLDDRIDEVRAQEASRDVTTGLRQDPIQPLMLRANLGECVVINLTNRLTAAPIGGPNNNNQIVQPGGVPKVSINAHGVAYEIDQGGSAVGDNPQSVMVAPGASRQYKFYLDPSMGEGGKLFTSDGESRQLTAHGLFGAILAQETGSRWLDPETGVDRTNDPNWSNWEAIIKPASGPSFRESAIMYHEIGDENFNLAQNEAEGALPGSVRVPMVDAGLSQSYRPNSRAINYRSEPFWRRLQLANEKSQGYGSYTFGDPATPIPRSYLNEPTKTRLMAPGGELLHVHHLHGGGDRWRANPEADNTAMFSGFDKSPVQQAKSIRLDSQTVGPGESFNLEHECGAGGCQAAAGDFLYHCHIAHHYIAGMWAFWRVFDTKQSGGNGQPPLAVLPGRSAPPTAVNSTGLINRFYDGKKIVPRASLTDPSTQTALEDWVERQLPPQGVRLDSQDATVWDYEVAGTPTAPLYRGEPEVLTGWANYDPNAQPPGPGNRPDLLFNPANGRPAWPLMRPHLGQRPPFSPNRHSGAPWLGENTSSTRPDGLCPSTAPLKTYDITAISLPIQTTDAELDTQGMIFTLNEDKDAVLAGTKPANPLAIRSNVGDCVAITMTSQLDAVQQPKVNMHTHFVQFDPQASDGVITGMSYEQSVKPVSTENRTLAAAASAGATTITVTDTTRLRPGISIAIGQGRVGIELRSITAIDPATGNVTLDQALARSHPAGEPVGVEFVQYRWFSDVDSGTVFWHDHVDGIDSWGHGLFGAHIIEPPGSTYHDPVTGAQVRSGPIVDIRTSGSVGVGQSGSFREFMLWLHNGREGNPADNAALNFGQECEEPSINLRAEPFVERVAAADRTTEQNGGVCSTFTKDPATGSFVNTFPGLTVGTTDPHVFSSVKYGDPRTPLLRAYVGDPVVIRTIGLAERVEALRIQGHRFRRERFHGNGELMDTATTGISERFDYVLDGGAGGPKRMAGDYLYYSSRTMEIEGGGWGIFRVHDKLKSDLKPLPNRTPPTGTGFPRLTFTGANPPPPTSSDVNPSTCPSTAPVKTFNVSVFNLPLPTSPTQDADGIVYTLSSKKSSTTTANVEPLVIRANAGECVVVNLKNEIAAGTRVGGTRASFSLAKLLSDPLRSSGTAVGFNPDSTVAAGATYTYRFYADRELGTSMFQNLGSPASLLHGAYGALIVEPTGSTYDNNFTGAPLASGTSAIIRVPGSSNDFREFVPLFLTTDPQQGRSIIPYSEHVMGLGLNARAPVNAPQPGFNHINYRSEPLTERLAVNDDHGLVFSSAIHGDPATPIFYTFQADPIRFRFGVPASQQFHSVTLDGHVFPWEPYFSGASGDKSNLISSRVLTAGETQEGKLRAGGPQFEPGDYALKDSRLAWRTAGLWGIFRVLPFPFFGSSASAESTSESITPPVPLDDN